jgi:peptide/nickel transport system substrate-binding protein
LRSRRKIAWLAVALTIGLLAAACGDSGGNDATGDPASNTATGPERGGVLTMATYLSTTSLDPLVNSGFGVAGGIELLAVYDTLLRWNPENGKYEPRIAQSLDPNDDFTVWTLKLRPNVKFTDGTTFDAAAVKFAIDRHRVGNPGAPPCEETRACPRSTVGTSAYMGAIANTEIVDPLTLRITLNAKWPSFPLVLAGEVGMVPSPTALKAACPADKTAVRDCSFSQHPVGAGPFMIDSFKPSEEVKLVRNPAYYGGEVPLDGLRFVSFNDAGGSKSADALRSGAADAAFLRTPVAVAAARDAGFKGYSAVQQAGIMSWLNDGIADTCQGGQPPACAGRADGPYTPPVPTANVKVRQAISAAVDRVQLDRRVSNGKGRPGSELLQKDYRLYPGVAGPGYDLDKAKQLVQQAKAEGWDGRVRLFCGSGEPERGVALKTMLEAAGITVDLNNQLDSAAMIQQVNVKRDFDMACAGLPISGDDLGLVNGIEGNLKSNSPRNRGGYVNPEMDKALVALHEATNDDEKRAALKTVSELYVRDVPFLVEGAIEEYVAWSGKVNGVYATQATEVFFDRAWLAR